MIGNLTCRRTPTSIKGEYLKETEKENIHYKVRDFERRTSEQVGLETFKIDRTGF